MKLFNIFSKKEKVDPARLKKYTETQLEIAFMRGAINAIKSATVKEHNITTDEAFAQLKNELDNQ